ncbi:MAG: hypothetical protein CMN30_09685 [Sandaracinus sp.]|nr:hypothetical protein [Sandaracinus sp.]|tara:strand:+ start:1645 stop:2148 length:504 start_codon:yes stop_codon:yes gene_type:complete
MFGFIIGLVSLFGLIKVLKGGRRGLHGGGCGHHRGKPGFGRGFGGGKARWRRRWLRGLFERLDTTPGQEKVIREALKDVFTEAEAARKAAPEVGSSLGAAFASPTLDDASIEEAMASADQGMARLREALKEALKRIHEALDDDQRQQLARWISRGGLRMPIPEGPYR